MSGFSWRGRCSSELVVWSSRDGLGMGCVYLFVWHVGVKIV